MKQSWQQGGKTVAPDCAHQSWRTYQTATKWWIRCEDCEGRMSSGKVSTQEDGNTVLHSWVPPSRPEPELEDEATKDLVGSWRCNMCRAMLAHGTKAVITEVGKICMICRTGPGKISKKKASSDHEVEEEEDALPSLPSLPSGKINESKKTPGKINKATTKKKEMPSDKPEAEKTMCLSDTQLRYLEENLTAKQWRELAIKGGTMTLQTMDKLEGMLSVKDWRQLWA